MKLTAGIVVTLIGLAVIVMLCLMTPLGRGVLALLGVMAALFALVIVSCLAGRIAAEIRNAIALHAGREKLERRMHASRAPRHTRATDLYPRPLA